MYKERFSAQVQAWLSDDAWLWVEEHWTERENLAAESLFTLCSGKMSSRGAHEEGFIYNSLPAHYVHGVFDRSEALQRELVNTPDWAKLHIYSLRDPISPNRGDEVSDYLRVLDVKHGVVAKRYIHRSPHGACTQVEMMKLLSREHPRCGAIRLLVTPLNYTGILEFENRIDGTVTNFADYPRFRVKHMKIREVYSLDGDGIGVLSETRDFLQAVATVAAVRLWQADGRPCETQKQNRSFGETACEFFDAKVTEGQTTIVDKFAAVAAARDGFDVRKEALAELRRFTEEGVERALAANREIYAALWRRADLRIEGDPLLQKAIRFDLFHLMSTPNPQDSRTNIGAKLLHGEEYGGHAFWDTELFILPFFSLVFPEQAKRLAEYRRLLLPGAKRNAARRGEKGARYPWESADTGDEECPLQTVAYDGSWEPCTVAEQELHITADVIYGGWQYWRFSGDQDYYERCLLEMMAETSRWWLSRAEWDAAAQRFDFSGVTGPDEWHEGVRCSFFTNRMAKWNLETASQALRRYRDEKPTEYARLAARLALREDEFAAWTDAAAKILLPAPNADGIYEEFAGYFALHDAEIDRWNERGMPLRPEALRSYPTRETTMIKQADVLMLMYLFDEEFSREIQKKNVLYYEKRTLHGSSLSPSIHCMMGLRVGETENAYEHLKRSLLIDLEDKHGNTREGLHAAAAGGSWQCLVFGFAGLRIRETGKLAFEPSLPKHWKRLCFQIMYQGCELSVEVSREGVAVCAAEETSLRYEYGGREYAVQLRGD